jgi:hypothetical protein
VFWFETGAKFGFWPGDLSTESLSFNLEWEWRGEMP